MIKKTLRPVPLLCLSAFVLGQGVALDARALSEDQEDACGALLCLLGGSGVGECALYLERYFSIRADSADDLAEKRRDLLEQCPDEDGSLAAPTALVLGYGASCQPDVLIARLNAEIRACEWAQARQRRQGPL
jgi:hypothetical protein